MFRWRWTPLSMCVFVVGGRAPEGKEAFGLPAPFCFPRAPIPQQLYTNFVSFAALPCLVKRVDEPGTRQAGAWGRRARGGEEGLVAVCPIVCACWQRAHRACGVGGGNGIWVVLFIFSREEGSGGIGWGLRKRSNRRSHETNKGAHRFRVFRLLAPIPERR